MKHVLSDIGKNDLGQIAAMLRSGRLQPPFSSAALSQLSTGHAVRLSSFLRQLFEEGMSIPHMVLLLESLVEERRRPRSTEADIELVTSGPEAPGITNRDTVVVVRELFQNANKSVLIAGYAVYQGKQVFAALARRMEEVPGLTVRMYLDVQRHPTDTSLSSGSGRSLHPAFQIQGVARGTSPGDLLRSSVPGNRRRERLASTRSASWSTGRCRSFRRRTSLRPRRSGISR